MKFSRVILLNLFLFLFSLDVSAQQDSLKYIDTSRTFLAPVKVNGLWGYIDPKGTWAIQPKFGEASNFHENLAQVVMYTGDKIKAGFIKKDHTKHLSIELTEYNPFRFTEGMLVYKENELYGFIDSTGKKVIPAQFKFVSNFKHGKAIVYFKNGKVGFINKMKQLLLAPRYDTAFDFNENFAIVGKKNQEGIFKYGCIDQYANLIIPVKYDFITNVSEGKAFANMCGIVDHEIVKGGCWYIIDLKNENIVAIDETNLTVPIDNHNTHNSFALQFNDSVAWFPGWDNNKINHGLMNTKGGWVVKPQYKVVNKISEGRSMVIHNVKKVGFIDVTGRLVIPYSLDAAGDFHSGLAKFRQGKKYGYINKYGTVVVPAQFDDAGDFVEVK